MRTRGTLVAVLLAVSMLGAVALAGGGWATTHDMSSGSVALTNGQANSAWAPVAVLWKFDAATNALVSVERVSQSNTYLLGMAHITNATSVVWVPEADYPFAEGDVLRVGCSVSNGVAQVIRKGE